jgi:hypothetical protein
LDLRGSASGAAPYHQRDTVRGIDTRGPDRSAEHDFLDDAIAKRTQRSPKFPELLDAARRRRALMRALAVQREEQQRSQTSVAADMATSQSAVARLESTASDAKISTVDRYAASLGYVVQYHLIPAEDGAEAPPVIVH